LTPTDPTNSNRALVIGIDGVPQTLLTSLMDKGVMPELKRITVAGYTLTQMDASVPDVSSTSWTSFMTGVNPGEHGIYGFLELGRGTYDITFPKSSDVTAPTIWEVLAGDNSKTSTLSDRYAGRVASPMRTIAMNIPQTYPARPLNGILTAGFVCPDMKTGTYPDSAYEYLKSIGYIPDVDVTTALDDTEGFFAQVFTALEKRVEAYEHLMRTEPWELFIGVVTETDRLHHFFFDAVVDDTHMHHGTMMRFYGELDRAIGRLYDLFMELTGGQGLFLTMSDHGFTTIESEVYLNPWLSREGFLTLKPDGEYFERISASTRAFNMDPARIYINRESRYPSGMVAEADVPGVVAEIKAALSSLTSPGGRPVIREVYTRDELYSGPSAGFGPDLVCLANDGFDLKGPVERPDVFGRGPFTGMHTSYDAHCLHPKGIFTDGRLHIENLAPVILDHLIPG